MESNTLSTLRPLVPEDIARSEAYAGLEEEIAYFERFVSATGVPDIQRMISELIAIHTQGSSSPHFSMQRDSLGVNYFSISGESSGAKIVYPGVNGLSFSYESDETGQREQPVIDIDSTGHKRRDWKRLREKGVRIQASNIPRDVAEIVLRDFDRVTGEDRNDILLKYAASEDLVNCYPEKDHWVNFHKRQLKEYGTILEGVDENSVWTLERLGDANAYGNAYCIKSNPLVFLDLRVERPGQDFAFPSISKLNC